MPQSFPFKRALAAAWLVVVGALLGSAAAAIPYDYALDPVADVPAIVMAGAGVSKL